MKAVCLFCLIVVALFSFVGCSRPKAPMVGPGIGNDFVLYPYSDSDFVRFGLRFKSLRDSLNLPSRAEELTQTIQSFQGDIIHRDQVYWFYTMGRSLAQLAVALQGAPASRRTIYLPVFAQGVTIYRRQVSLPLVHSVYEEDQAVLRWVIQLNPQDSMTWSPPEVLLRGALE